MSLMRREKDFCDEAETRGGLASSDCTLVMGTPEGTDVVGNIGSDVG